MPRPPKERTTVPSGKEAVCPRTGLDVFMKRKILPCRDLNPSRQACNVGTALTQLCQLNSSIKWCWIQYGVIKRFLCGNSAALWSLWWQIRQTNSTKPTTINTTYCIIFANRIESTKFIQLLCKINQMWKHVRGDWSQTRTNTKPIAWPSDCRLPLHADSATTRHSFVCISCYQSRHRQNLI
jgi:hypothetical protein